MIRINSHIPVLWIMVLFMTLDCPAAASVPSVSELIEKYGQALDSTQSMISSYETSIISSAYLPPLNLKYVKARTSTRGQRRTDGKGRIYNQEYLWGYNLQTRRNVTEERGRYALKIGTPDFHYGHNKHTRGQTSGTLTYSEHRPPGWDNFRNKSDAFYLGYLGNDSRIDINLKNAKKIFVRRKPEIINGSVCYVVEADTAYGDYTVWLDSAHGFQPARIEGSSGDGDILNVTKFQPPPDKRVEGKETFVIDNIAFKKVQGVWIPVEGRMTSHIEWPKYGFFVDDEINFKTKEIVFNPDHDALNSFADPMKNPELDPELVNGTRVRLGRENLKCVWRDGKAIPDIGKIN